MTAKSSPTNRCTVANSEKGLTGTAAKRRVCLKGAPNKNSNKGATFVANGGASMFMTRNNVGSGTNKYRVGTIPYKTKFVAGSWYSGPDFWSPLLISGDNSDPPSF